MLQCDPITSSRAWFVPMKRLCNDLCECIIPSTAQCNYSLLLLLLVYSLKRQPIICLMQPIVVRKILSMVTYTHAAVILSVYTVFVCQLGVSECIIMGIPMNIGTGMFKVLYR